MKRRVVVALSATVSLMAFLAAPDSSARQAGSAAQKAPIERASASSRDKSPFADTDPGVIATVVADLACHFRSCVGGLGGDGGPAIAAGLQGPRGLFVDSSGNLWIADSFNHRIRRVDRVTGVITTVAGNPRCFQNRCDGAFSGDGGLAVAAELNNPSAVAVDGDGNVFISDYSNNRIRKVDKITGIITTVVGSFRGDSGDGGPARNAELNGPWGLALDASGNLFIADSGNGRVRRVDKLTGIITTVAGLGRGVPSGDGRPAVNAALPQPFGVSVDAEGNLFISSYNSVRRVDHATRIITTVAGGNGRGFGGDGGPAVNAQMSVVEAIAVDGSGNLFVADSGNLRVRRVDHATGIITTVAGTGTQGFQGDGGPATSADMGLLMGITVDESGNVFIADTNNHRIRRVQMSPGRGASRAKR